jgi:hypothetical protein
VCSTWDRRRCRIRRSGPCRVPVDELAVGVVVADNDVQVAVAIDIGQRRRISAVGRSPQVSGAEAAAAIVQEHAIEERPVPPFAKDDVQQAVSIEVAHADAGGGFGVFLKQQNAIERTQGLSWWRLGLEKQNS